MNLSSCEDAVLLAEQILNGAGTDAPRFEAQLIVALALGVSRTQVVARAVPGPTSIQQAELHRLLRQRAQRVPLAYLRGSQEFYGLTFAVSGATLIPRPETELLVDFALNVLSPLSENPVFVDVGTGSGCIAISILKHAPNVRAIAIDLSCEALNMARENALRHGVLERIRFVQGSMLDAVRKGGAQLIVSNPPYIASAEIADLQPEVRDYEPRMALDGGVTGLRYHYDIARNAPRVLIPGGRLAVECGLGQAHLVESLFEQAGMTEVKPVRDLTGIERIVTGTLPLK